MAKNKGCACEHCEGECGRKPFAGIKGLKCIPCATGYCGHASVHQMNAESTRHSIRIVPRTRQEEQQE